MFQTISIVTHLIEMNQVFVQRIHNFNQNNRIQNTNTRVNHLNEEQVEPRGTSTQSDNASQRKTAQEQRC